MHLSTPLRIMFFFIRNPDEELLTRELAEKFNVDSAVILDTLKKWRELHMFTAVPQAGHYRNGPGNQLVWSAGPLLRELTLRTTDSLVEELTERRRT